MNCNRCKKNICKGYNRHVLYGWNDEEYCEKKIKIIQEQDPLEETIKLIEKSICQLKRKNQK